MLVLVTEEPTTEDPMESNVSSTVSCKPPALYAWSCAVKVATSYVHGHVLALACIAQEPGSSEGTADFGANLGGQLTQTHFE